ncbi:MAG TPA: hypothetical protein VHK02_04850 [Actinomycetota bacterium]|jgi:hypothetical protein|nr:hypothetical protein [Actinomycetota bacterium]
MTVRIVSRLILLLVALAAATALVVGGLSMLASAGASDATPLLQRDQAAVVRQAIETPAEGQRGGSPTPLVVLVFAGVVLIAALPPVHRVHVYHRYGSYHRPDWF